MSEIPFKPQRHHQATVATGRLFTETVSTCCNHGRAKQDKWHGRDTGTFVLMDCPPPTCVRRQYGCSRRRRVCSLLLWPAPIHVRLLVQRELQLQSRISTIAAGRCYTIPEISRSSVDFSCLLASAKRAWRLTLSPSLAPLCSPPCIPTIELTCHRKPIQHLQFKARLAWPVR